MPESRGLRTLPSVASLLASDAARALLRSHPRTVVVDALREVVGRARAAVGEERVPLSREAWTVRILSMLPGEIASRESLPMRRVINAAGIVVHTNLGRAPLPELTAKLMHAGVTSIAFAKLGWATAQW